jgi:hypothetical protein
MDSFSISKITWYWKMATTKEQKMKIQKRYSIVMRSQGPQEGTP